MSNWVVTTSGPLVQTPPLFNNQWGGTFLALSQRNSESFLSVADNNPTLGNGGPVTVRLSTTFQARAGVTYNLSFRMLADNSQTGGQTVAFNVGGANVFRAATKSGLGPTLVIGNGVELPYNPSWTAATSGPTTAEFVFTLPLAPTNDDIRITLPLITNAVC